MHKIKYKTVKDSMGEMQVPEDALYAAQTQRAIQNFQISGLKMPPLFIQALGLVKSAAAQANMDEGLLDKKKSEVIQKAADTLSKGEHYDAFPVDVFQTGSGTSTNMNANEVIAELCQQQSEMNIHPNDDVNMSQSSNDVIPTTIHVSSSLGLVHELLPQLEHLTQTLEKRAKSVNTVVKTGRTHLMDAMPLTLGDELKGWAAQIAHNRQNIEALLPAIHALAIGGTAVGTGINAPPDFGQKVSQILAQRTGIHFTASDNRFAAISSQDAVVALSGQLKTTAVSLMKISNDLRWMNAGPLAGLGEITLKPLQPGSSIMPGKINPVVPEAVTMVCAQVIGNDATITVAGQSGNFQLNVMLPVIAYNILQSIHILATAAKALADEAIASFTVNEDHISEQLARNPILITALNTVIGYEIGAKIAKTAYERGASVLEVAKEMTDIPENELIRLLDPAKLTKGGLP